MHPLLLALDFDRPGLEAVKRAFDAMDASSALHAIASYFRSRTEPDPTLLAVADADAAPEADRAIRREFVFYNETGTVPPGDWDWTWKPGTDWEWTWALNRHYFWRPLASAWLATRDERYPRELDAELKSWVGGHPATEDDRACWRTLEAGVRMATSWPPVLAMMKASACITDEAWFFFLRSIADHAEHLLAHPKINNWLLAETNGLITCALLFPEFRRSAEWLRIAVERFTAEMDRQVHPDGAHIEYSSGYHFFCIASFTQALDKAERVLGAGKSPFPPEYRERLAAMWEHAMYMLRPDGMLPMLNDGEQFPVAPRLIEASERYDRPDFLYAATNGAQGTPPAETSHRFPWVRRAVMRSGWDADAYYAFLEAAPLEAGHVHEDALTFELFAHGTPLIGTMGRYTYTRIPVRLTLVNSRGHNTVLVDGQGQLMKKTDPDRSRWVATGETDFPWVSTPALDVAFGRYDGPWTGDLAGVVQERRLAFHKPDDASGRPAFWVVRDTFLGEGEHELRFLLHFYPGDITWDERAGEVVSSYGVDRGNVVVRFADTNGLAFDCAKGQEEPARGWFSPVYGKIFPAWEVAAVRRATFPATFSMVFVPFRGEKKLEVRAEEIPGGVRATIDGQSWEVPF